MGRPKIPKAQQKQTVRITLPPGLKERAHDAGVNISEVAAKAVAAAVKKAEKG